MENDFLQKSQMIRQLAALTPDQFSEQLSAAHPGISEAAPNLAPHIFSAASNAVQFLNRKLPSHGNEMLQDSPILPSQAVQNSWLDLHKAVNNPISVLEHVREGTLTSHHVEALQSVYPDLHQEMKNRILEELGTRKMSESSIPYQKRIAISKFLGQPIDSTMTQSNLMAIIRSGTQNTTPQTEAKPRKKSSASELSQINKVTSLYQTPIQAREASQVGSKT